MSYSNTSNNAKVKIQYFGCQFRHLLVINREEKFNESKSTLKLNHSGLRVSVITKQMDLPSVYAGNGVNTALTIHDGFKINQKLFVTNVDTDEDLVELSSLSVVDITDRVEISAISGFILSMKKAGWLVEVNHDAIDKLVNPKSKELIKSENTVKYEKPKKRDFVIGFVLLMAFNISYQFKYADPTQLISNILKYLVGTIIVFFNQLFIP